MRTFMQAQLTALGGEGCGSGCEGGLEPGVGILERCATGVTTCLGEACLEDAGTAIPWCVELEYVCLWKLGGPASSRSADAVAEALSALASKLRLAVCRDLVLLGLAIPEARCPGVLLKPAAMLLGLGLLLMLLQLPAALADSYSAQQSNSQIFWGINTLPTGLGYVSCYATCSPCGSSCSVV
jgi:hypothetical protein